MSNDMATIPQLEQLKKVKKKINYSFSAALYAVDYKLLKLILDASKKATKAFENNQPVEAIYQINQVFWNIGQYIQDKFNRHPLAQANFLMEMSYHIAQYLNVNTDHSFSPENLQRCFKLIHLIDKKTFLNISKRYTWTQMIQGIDLSQSKEEFLNYLGEIFE